MRQYAQGFPKIMDRVRHRIQVINKAEAGDTGSRLVNFGKYATWTWRELLESEEAKDYISWLLNPTTKSREGSRMEQLVEWIKSQKSK